MKTKLAAVFIFLIMSNLAFAQELRIPEEIDLSKFNQPIDRDIPAYSLRTEWGISSVYRIWGWSRTGKIAYSTETVMIYKGGIEINFNILDSVTDEIVFSWVIDSSDYVGSDWDGTIKSLYQKNRTAIANAMREHGIVEAPAEFLPLPISRRGNIYIFSVINTMRAKNEWGFYDNSGGVIQKFDVTAETGGKRKTIFSFNDPESRTGHAYITGFFMSPYEERALIVIAEEYRGYQEVMLRYTFAGCHLNIGFN